LVEEATMLAISDDWKKAYPGAHVGILVMSGVSNPDSHQALDLEMKQLEEDLRTLFKHPEDLKVMDPIKSYQAYYKRFKKTYHVQQQLESVVFKGKSIPRVAALVEAMFMEELRNMLLTSGHDLDTIEMPLKLDTSKGGEKYVRIGVREQELKPGDMIISDSRAVISSVVYGPDERTRIVSGSRNALFVTYGVPGIGELAVRQHLEGIAANVRLITPDCAVESLKVYAAV
jgi:DNA/RNA-binding domain of Phe-tRNA-synthetase-like protein